MGDNSTNFGVLSGLHYTPCSTGSSGRPSLRRACDKCRGKKTRCDMLHPKCSLCSRIGSKCTYSAGEGERDCRQKSVGASDLSLAAKNKAKNDHIATDEFDMSLFDVQYFDTSVAGFLDSTDGLLGLSPSVDEMTWLDIDTISPGSVYHFGQDFDRLSLSPDTSDRYGLMISSSLADELIDIYFDKVQAFCPLFLRTKFNQDLAWNHMANQDQRHPGLSPVYQFILNGMFALSARFSNAPEFIGIDPTCRDQIFVKRATKLWETISRDFKHCLHTLQCLQGLILLTFNSLLSGPSEDAWIQSGTCVRLAYDLDLHTTDAHKQPLRASSPLQQNQEAWVLLEERRRAWWMVWEIDTFSSAVSLRPFAIDSRFVHVLLPVSDDDWNNKAQAPSASLNANGGMPWKHLAESSNRSERAWFLVCLAVFRQACDAAVPPGPSVQMLHHAEAAIGCAFLALPPSFQDFSMSAASCHTSYVTFNWIACSLIVLNCARTLLMLKQNETPGNDVTLQPVDVRPPRIYLPTIIEVYRATQLLSPQYLPLCSPFIFCALVGPGTVHVPDDRVPIESQSASLYAETIRLVLSNVARHWSIGGVLLDVIDYKKSSKPASPDEKCSKNPFIPEWRALVDDIF